MNDSLQLYNSLGGGYLSSMFLDNDWTRYVDKKEKETVMHIWKIGDSQKNREEKVLDLGVGPGRWSQLFVRKGFCKIVGVDIAKEMVDFATRFIDSRKFIGVVANMQKLTSEKNSFEKVFCFRAFKYVEKPQLCIREIERVLRPEGTLLLEVPNKSLQISALNYLTRVLIKLNPDLSLRSRWYFDNASFYSKEEAESLISNSNLQILSVYPFFILPAIPLPTAKGSLTWFWITFDRLLFSLLPKRWFTRSWILLASKPKTNKANAMKAVKEKYEKS